MLSGQGSQYYHMGLDFYSENEHFNKNINSLNEIIKERFNISLIDIMYNHEKTISTPFSDPLLSSLAIYLIEHALVSTLINYGIKPDKIIASSMGIFVASIFANCIDTSQGLEALYHLMSQIKEKCSPGRMLAVLTNPKFYYDSKVLQEHCELAAADNEFSFVLSMSLNDVKHVEEYLDEAGVASQHLPVSRAYHSHSIDEVKESFLNINLPSNKPSVPLICCTKTEELDNIRITDLWHAVRNPLLFSDTIAKIEKSTACRYIDVGPSGMMATCLKYILPKNSESEIYTILNPYKQASKNFARVLTHCA